MKILFILNSFGPASGAEHVLLDFIKSAPEIEPLFLHIGPQKLDISGYSQVTSEENCYYLHTDMPIMTPLSRQWFMPIIRSIMCWKLGKEETTKKLKNDKSIDLIYFNNSFEASAFYPLFADKKNIVHIHDMIDMFRPAQKECVLEACMRTDYVITASKACGRMLEKNGISSDKIKVAYNGISSEAIPYIERKNEKLAVGFVGSAIKRKGFDIYIDILNCLVKSGLEVAALIITGTKADDPYFIENINRLNSNIKRVVYNGISRDEVFKKYGEMDLLLVPSRFDPLPTVVLEASLAGVPVIGANVDGIPEMVCKKEMLFQTDDVEDAVKTITNWASLTFTQRKKTVEEIQTHIANTFTTENKRACIFSVINHTTEQGEKTHYDI